MDKRSDKSSSQIYSCFNQKWEVQRCYTISPSAVYKLCWEITCHRNARPSTQTFRHNFMTPCLCSLFVHKSVSDFWPSSYNVRSTAEDLMKLNKSHITFWSVMFPAGSSCVRSALMFGVPLVSVPVPSRCWHTLLSTLMVSCLFQDVNCSLPYHGDTHTRVGP